MKLADLVLIGTVTDLTVRTGRNDRGPWEMETAYLVGPRSAFAVTLPDELKGQLAVGDDVALSVYVRVYNGRVDYSATGLWDGELPGSESDASRAA